MRKTKKRIFILCLLAACCLAAGCLADPAQERTRPEWLKGVDLPEYKPVKLANPHPDPIPVTQEALYAPHAGSFLPDDNQRDYTILKVTPATWTEPSLYG